MRSRRAVCSLSSSEAMTTGLSRVVRLKRVGQAYLGPCLLV